MSVAMPAMTDAQTVGWLALLDLYDRKPTGWPSWAARWSTCAAPSAAPARPGIDCVTPSRVQRSA